METTPTATWGQFRDAEPMLAEFGMKRLAGRVAYLATIRKDGAPRVHPVTPHFEGTTCFIYMEPTSPKGSDLRRDSRFALHCGVEDNEGGGGEFGMRGCATLIVDRNRVAELFLAARAEGFQARERYIVFELQIETAFSTNYGDDGSPLRRAWKFA